MDASLWPAISDVRRLVQLFNGDALPDALVRDATQARTSENRGRDALRIRRLCRVRLRLRLNEDVVHLIREHIKI
jgi:hypothetical protein